MAQVKFGVCVNEFAPRPDLVPTFIGTFEPWDQPRCVGKDEEKRRNDVKPGQYGTGTPSILSIQRDPWGVPLRYNGGYDIVQTEQGPIKLSKDDTVGWDDTFLPTVSILNMAPLMDNRMRPLSDRYYKR
jgi:hypothetical protein